MTYRKKLIEVALPLEAINEASAHEKTIRQGHPSTLHLWWARRPLAAARAIIFAQMVDDPSEYIEELFSNPQFKQKAENIFQIQLENWENQRKSSSKLALSTDRLSTKDGLGGKPTLENVGASIERDRLFQIIKQLVIWENTNNEKVISQAREEIWRNWRRNCKDNLDNPTQFDPKKLPSFHDPFSGGGALPFEAQRLGLESFASDLNPVAVVINKAMIEIPSKFAGLTPINPVSRGRQKLIANSFRGVEGFAQDISYYGEWVRKQAEERIGPLYPRVKITYEMSAKRPDLKKYVGRELSVISWIWARTIKSPNPAFSNVDIPLTTTFIVSAKKGKEVYIQPKIENSNYHFEIKTGNSQEYIEAANGTKLARGANFKCILSGTPISDEYTRNEFRAKRTNIKLMAIVAEGDHERVYLSPNPEHEMLAKNTIPKWRPEQDMNQASSNLVSGRGYGISHWYEIFTNRQLVALSTLSDIIQEAIEQVKIDINSSIIFQDGYQVQSSLDFSIEYANAIALILSFALSKQADLGNSLCRWEPIAQCPRQLFARQAIPMVWDFAESNPLGNSSGSWSVFIEGIVRSFTKNFEHVCKADLGISLQADASSQNISINKVISTDPPYYDNIAYADLSDFFYIWLRRTLKNVYPELFTTLEVPKTEELVALASRHGSKEKAEAFFLDGMTKAMSRLCEQGHPNFPVTIYYAFKQTETDKTDGVASTGWETFLDAVIRAGFSISGTWPIRTENSSRMIGQGTNALASSIVLVCRPRITDAPIITRRQFISILKTELPTALQYLQEGNIAPVDLAQAAIGPGMAIFTRYEKIMDAQGHDLSVRHALTLINQALDEALAEQEGDFDPDTRWALAWFEQCGFTEGEFGVAEVLARAKDTSVEGMVDAGILYASHGIVRLLKPSELFQEWDPRKDKRLTAWEMVHQLIRVLEASGEGAASEIVTKLGSKAETARELCYRLYTICERKKRSTEALSYNSLVQSWPEITRLAREKKQPIELQQQTFL